MSKTKCCDCGEVFDEEDAETIRECVGEFWGVPAYQDIDVCPRCRSTDIEEFTYPSDECCDNKSCDFNCDNCDYRKEEN